MSMMEMGNSMSSIPCIMNNNDGSQHHAANAVIDIVYGNGDTHRETPNTNTATTDTAFGTNQSEDTMQHEFKDDSIHLKWTKAIKKIFQFLEELMVPKSLLLSNSSTNHPRLPHPISSRNTSTRNFTGRTSNSTMNSCHSNNHALLRRCTTLTEQHAYIQMVLNQSRHLHGLEGLHALGFEYRFIPCDEHITSNDRNVAEGGCDVSCAVAVDTVPLNDYHVIDEIFLSEQALQDAKTFQIDNDDENENFELEEEGQITFVELAKMKSETFLNLSNRSDSILSDDGGGSSTNNAEIGTTPSLATTFTATVPPFDEEEADDDMNKNRMDDHNDALSCHQRNTSAATERLKTPNIFTTTSTTPTIVYKNPEKKIVHQFCHLCERRLYDIGTNTCITDQNRTEYIANGEMYELVSRFVQEYAHDIMIQEGNLTWIDIEDEPVLDRNSHTRNRDDTHSTATESTTTHSTNETRPIRCLISRDHPCLLKKSGSSHDNDDKAHRPTLLICTGRGKVRAGIFSRHHLICTGLERSTAIPFVHEAIHRNVHVILVDPNVNGETHGFTTFTKSMNFLQSYYDSNVPDDKNESMNHIDSNRESIPKNPCCRDIYILSHSASGGHLVRYFLDKCHTRYIRNVRAIAFTDSTHSIQWAKSTDQAYLYDLLQSLYCIYFRCSSSTRDTIAGDGDSKWYLHPAGEVVQTDSFWRHRFGAVRTVWAGTNEHSQTNWFAHAKIWEHFDQFLFS